MKSLPTALLGSSQQDTLTLSLSPAPQPGAQGPASKGAGQ